MTQWRFTANPDGTIDVVVRAPGGDNKGSIQLDTYVDFDEFVLNYPTFVDDNELNAPVTGPP